MMTLGFNANAFGSYLGEWRHPAAPDRLAMNFDLMRELATTAERGMMDFFFLADGNGVRQMDKPELFAATSPSDRPVVFEPVTLLSALSMATQNIGLIATATTTYDEPYHIARKFSSLDHLSGGRAGWNVVTSSHDLDALNFSHDAHPDRSTRYARAQEFVTVVKGLWDSWADDALEQNKASGKFLNPDRVHVLDHVGPNFSVKGPLNIARAPQGYPVIFSAGQSEGGLALSASIADCVFAGVGTKTEGQALRANLRERAVAAGRQAEDIRVLPSLTIIVGNTDAEAEALKGELERLVPEAVGVAYLSYLLEMDLAGYAVDGPVPAIDRGKAGSSARRSIADMIEAEQLTIRQAYGRVIGHMTGNTLLGGPDRIADAMEEWYREGACDGFVISVPVIPGGLARFVDLVVPRLQERGIFKKHYAGKTLRENIGSKRPDNQFFMQSSG